MKKVLAWAVALALVLSSFTMAFAADTKTSKDFKDASSINYTEAVDVMVATGIINGFPDGTFGPQKTVKRSEMSKMIACIMNSGEDVGDQFKGACPFADSKDHWAAGYIAYCASEHIIDGRSADVFDPEATVTGTEVAKMALTSLGYDSQIQGYVGENWAANVLKDAKKNDLFDGLASDFVPGDPCTREAAAQILFNMLQAPTVEYDTNTTVSVGDATVAVNSKVNKVVADKEYTDAAKTSVKDGETGYVELYEDVFGGDLVKKPSTTSEGKPAHKWTYEKEEIGEYPDSADETATVDEANQTAKDIVEDVDEDASVGTVTLNGDLQKGTADNFAVLVGDKVEMFKNGTDAKGNDVYDLVVTRYTLAKIIEVNTDVTAKDAKDDVTAYVTINDKTYNDTDVAGFDAATYKDDVYLAVAFKANKDILESYVAETDQGVIEKKTKSEITVNGKASEMSGNYAAGVNSNTKSIAWGTFDVKESTYDVYFDSEGYVLGVVVFDEESKDVVGVFDGKKTDTDSYDQNKKTVTIKVVDEKVATNEYVVTKAVYDESADPAVNKIPASTALIKYELNDNNKVKNIINTGTEFGTVTANDQEAAAEATGKEVSKRGIMGSYILAEDVVAWYKDLADPTDEESEDKWVTYGYNDLLESTVPFGTTFITNSDGEIAYMLLSGDIADNTEDTVLGFYVTANSYDVGEGNQYDITVLKNDGTEETITTAKDAEFANGIKVPATGEEKALLDDDATAPVLLKLVKNGDGNAKTVSFAECNSVADPSSEFSGKDALAYSLNGEIAKVSGQNLTFDGTSATPQYVGDATVLRVKVDSDGKYAGLTKSTAKYVAGGHANLYKFDKDADSWDTVVYWTKADYDALYNTYTITVNGSNATNNAPATAVSGTSVTVEITAADGYLITGVSGVEGGTPAIAQDKATATYTFTMPSANATITVATEAATAPANPT